MRLTVCPICGLASGPADSLCRKCGNALVPPQLDSDTRSHVAPGNDEPSETYKFVALGVFIGCLVAGCLVLWLMIGTSHASKQSDDQSTVKGMSVTPQPSTSLDSSSDADADSTDDSDTGAANRLKFRHHRRSDNANQKSSGYGKAEVYTGHGKTPTMVEPE